MRMQGAVQSMILAGALAAAGLVAVASLSRAAPTARLLPMDDTAVPGGTSSAEPITPTLSVTGTGTVVVSATVTAPSTLAPTATVTATATASPTITPSPTARPAPPGCRVVGSTLTPDAEDASLYWARVQNSGPVTVTLSALQAGWTGPVALGQVLLRRDGSDSVAFDGLAPSPALVSLAGAAGKLRLPPGETVTLGLRFQPLAGEPAGPVTPGATVLFTSEGCLVPLAAAPPAARCGLSAGGLRVVTGNPAAVALDLTNEGAEPQTVASVEVRWPSTESGALLAVQWGEGPTTALAQPLASSPAVLDLRQVLGAAPTLVAGKSATLRLTFARAAAPPPALYTVVFASRSGCLATATTALGSTECGVSAQGFETRGTGAVLRLNNRRPFTRTLSALTLFWPAKTNGPLVGVVVDGRTVWSGELEQSPAELALPDVLLAGDATAQLQLSFQPPTGLDGQPGSIASGDYTVLAWLRGACAVPFATASGQPLKCSVAASEWTLRSAQEASVDLSNAGAEATLRQVALTWPRRNGNLTGAWLGSTALFSGAAPARSEPFVLRFLPGRGAVLPRNDFRTLRLLFDQPAAAAGYSASLEFDDPAGSSCADVLVTSRPAPVECKLTLSDLALRGSSDVDVAVLNQGADAVEVASVIVSWPTPVVATSLTQVTLVDAVGTELVLWRGSQAESPATVRPNAGIWPLLAAQSTAALRMRFSPGLNLPDEDQSFQVTLTTVEGCQASFAPADGGPSSQQTSFSGSIDELPREKGLYGIWRITTDRGTRQVVVDRTTSFSPASVSPRVGDVVSMRAMVADGQFYAQEVRFTEFTSYSTFEGLIEDLGPEPPPAWLKVAGTVVAITGKTVWFGEPLARNANVRVVARRHPDNFLEAETITVRGSAPRDEAIAFTGVLQEARQELGSQVWEVDRYTVRILPSVDTGMEPAGSFPQPGRRVEVRGRYDGAEVLAESIKVLPELAVWDTDGHVLSMPAAGLLGEWRVRTVGPQPRELTFRVESPSVVDTRAAPALVGMLLHLRLQDGGEGKPPVAIRVRADWPD